MASMLMNMQPQMTANMLINHQKNENNYNDNINTNEYDYKNHDYNNNNNNNNTNKQQFYNTEKPTTMRHSSSSQQSTTNTNDEPTIVDDIDDISLSNETTNTNLDDNDEFGNILSLQLRKPKKWRWELSTSKSCAKIALPRILLYDHKGNLLIDVNSQEEQCFSEQKQLLDPQQNAVHSLIQKQQPIIRKRSKKAATTNLAHSIRKALDRQLSDLHIKEATPPTSTSSSKILSAATTTTSEQISTPNSSSSIDFYTNDLPEYKISRSNSLKSVQFKINDNLNLNISSVANSKNLQHSINLADLPTPPSTITTTTTPTNSSSSSGPRQKRRYRRSHSSTRSPATSESILERFSFNKGRLSSPEFVEEEEVYRPPRYFLRTCRAGTLLLPHESFSRYRRRRKPRNSSEENIQSCNGSGSKTSLKSSESVRKNGNPKYAPTNKLSTEQSCDNLWNVSDLEVASEKSKKIFPVRRHRSDGSVLLHLHSISSDEESERVSSLEKDKMEETKHILGADGRKQCCKELIKIDSDNDEQRSANCSESR